MSDQELFEKLNKQANETARWDAELTEDGAGWE